MSYHFGNIAEAVAELGLREESELLALRAGEWGENQITRDDAETVFSIHRKIATPTKEWTDFFVKTIGDYVLWGTAPEGECAESEAMWLMGQIDCDVRLETMAEMDVLLYVIENSCNISHALRRYALDKIEMTVLTDIGPTRRAGILADTHIKVEECELIRRIVFADGGKVGGRSAVVGYHEAETIFRLKDATIGRGNSPDWAQLFVDAVANYLQQLVGGSITNDEELGMSAEDAFVSNHSNFVRFVRRIVQDVPAIGKAIGMEDGVSASGENSAFAPYDALEQTLLERLKSGK